MALRAAGVLGLLGSLESLGSLGVLGSSDFLGCSGLLGFRGEFHCDHDKLNSGKTRRMNSPNKGTVKAMSPYDEL
jgi:hypothetical protein